MPRMLVKKLLHKQYETERSTGKTRIAYEVTFSPTYVASSISEFFGVSQETIYNGEEQVPVQKMGDRIDKS
ncbi:MAG: hypothetical protein V8R15_00105 [Bacilli bacterium]